MELKFNVSKGGNDTKLLCLTDDTATSFYMVGFSRAADPRIELNALNNLIQEVQSSIDKVSASNLSESNKEIELTLLKAKKQAYEDKQNLLIRKEFSSVDTINAVYNAFRQDERAMTVNSISTIYSVADMREIYESPQEIVNRSDGSLDLVFELSRMKYSALADIIRFLGESDELHKFFQRSGALMSYRFLRPSFKRTTQYISLFNRNIIVD